MYRFLMLGSPLGAEAINFTVIYTVVKIIHTGEKHIVCVQRLYCNPETHNIKKGWINVDSTLFQRCVSTGSVFRICVPINSNSVILNGQSMVVCNYIK